MNSYINQIMISGKTVLRMGFILCSMLLLSPQDANATHIVGGDLTYRCLGNNMYEIRLTLRRDCLLGAPDAQFDDPASIGFYDLTTNMLAVFVGFGGQLLMPYNADDTLNQILISDCTIAGNDVCVHQTTYIDTIFLPQWNNGYVMAYQRCCRNGSLNNILEPLNTGMTLIAELTGMAQTQCNSSPQFGDYPPIYICVNSPINFDHSATDMEGDSLVYSLETPFAGGDAVNNRPQPPPPPPYNLVNWRPPYNLSNLMGGTPLQINPNTGTLTGMPNTIGQFVIGITVTAYRNGVVTGKTRRDFQYNVRMCRDVPVANWTAPALNCESLTVNFTNQSNLADNHLWIFDYGNPNSATSNVINPVYTYPEDGCYDVALIVNDDDMICYDTLIQQVCVFTSLLNAEFNFNVSACTDEIVIDVTDLSSDPEYPLAQWEWLLTYSGGIIPSTDQHPTFTFDINEPSTVCIALLVTDINGCTATKTRCFPVRKFDIEFNPEADSICKGDMVHLILNGDPELTYTWSPPNGLDLTNPWDPIAFPGISTCYYVTVTDGYCVIEDSICVNVQQLPTLSFTHETDCKSLFVTFTNTSTNGVNYFWDFGDPDITTDTSSKVNPTYTYNKPGVYTVTLFSADGCNVFYTKTITANTITETLDDQTINCFFPSIELNPDFNPDYTYVWSPAEFLSDPNSPNPLATVIDDTKFYVTITDANLPGCEIVDSILVIIPDDFFINAPDDITYCDFSKISLTAETNGNVEVVWKDSLGNVIGTGLILVVSPLETTTYTVMAMDSLGCVKSDIVTVFRPDPTFAIVATNDSAYCDIQTITLTVSSIPGITFEWFNANGDLVGTGDSVEVTPATPMCFYVIGTDPLDCQVADTVCLTPTFFNLSISSGLNICLGEQVTVSVTDANGQNLTYVWNTGDNTSSISVSPEATTTYTVTVTNETVGCEVTLTSTVVVNLFDPLVISIDADPDSVVITESSQLTVNQDPGYGYVWSSTRPGEIISGIYNPVVTPMGTTTYTVTVTNDAGCTGTASITITVFEPFCDERDIFFPNAFTPNNDGKNDVLLVRSNFVTDLDLHIYNRWGEEVFKSNNINNGWDGTYNGKVLPPDVFGYYFTATCPNAKTYTKQGNVTLLH